MDVVELVPGTGLDMGWSEVGSQGEHELGSRRWQWQLVLCLDVRGRRKVRSTTLRLSSMGSSGAFYRWARSSAGVGQ